MLLLSDVHLTNVAIQKKGDDYDADSGGKWDVRSLKLYLLSKYGADRVNTLFFGIQLICIRSLLSVQKVIINDKHSFELYGYDILIDADLKPWLIEVNASPSLTANTPRDYQMKLALLQDTITIVDMEKKSVAAHNHAEGFRREISAVALRFSLSRLLLSALCLPSCDLVQIDRSRRSSRWLRSDLSRRLREIQQQLHFHHLPRLSQQSRQTAEEDVESDQSAEEERGSSLCGGGGGGERE